MGNPWALEQTAGGGFGWANYVASLKLNYIYEVEIMDTHPVHLYLGYPTKPHTGID